MAKVNIKKHALMRYLQRTNNEIIINDSTFVNWSKEKENQFKIKEAEKKLIDIFENHDFKYSNKLSIDKNKVDYIVSEENKCVLVTSGQDIITYYPLVYSESFDDKTNLDLFKNLKRMFNKTNKKIISLETKNKNKIEINNEKIDTINLQINSLEEKIKFLKEKRSSLEFENKSLSTELESLRKELETLVVKMVKPIVAI